MTARSPTAFLLSFALHAIVVGLALLVGFATRDSAKDLPKIFELVAGEGDNYLAREAPALGNPDGVKLNIPNAVAPTPEPPRPQPAKIEPAPIAPAPTRPKQEAKVVPAPKAEPKTPDFAKSIKTQVQRAERKAKQEVKKAQEAEAKRLAEEQKKMTKEEFDRANKAKATPAPAPTKAGPPKVAKIDAEGIAKGVTGGSTKNKVGGAGGKALTADTDRVLDAYYSLFKQRLRQHFEAPTNASESLEVGIDVRNDANGALSNARVVKTSGHKEFDDAVLDAIRRMRMPARPDGRSETLSFVFKMREQE